MEKGYTDKEISSLNELMKLTHSITTEEQFNEPDQLIRLLRAREFNIKNSFEMWKKWHEWRVAYRADCITKEEMIPQISTGKAFYFLHDKNNRPCLIVRPRHHWPGQFTMEETMRYAIYLMEKGVKKADKMGSGQVCVIYDRGGTTSENRDNGLISLFRELVSMLQDFYAERLGALYILHVNWIFWAIFQIIRPFLAAKTKSKLHILKDVNKLKEFFDSDKLLKEYGGESEYIHPYPPSI